MRTIRALAISVIAALITIGILVDQADRPVTDRTTAYRAAVADGTGPLTTWFCPGGSGPGGVAELAVEIISDSAENRRATISVAPGGRVAVEGALTQVEVAPGDRVVVEPADLVPGAAWVGAIVEIDGPDVVVEQSVVGAVGGVGRSPCLTRTATSWIVPDGATRFEAEGERFVVMMLNPFPDDAVANIEFAADVGPDSLEGVVIPAGEVVGIDVTEEVTVANHVTVTIDIVAGRVSVSRIQVVDGETSGFGVRTAPATPDGAAVYYLPLANITDGRRDMVAVTNPSLTDIAEVDLEVLADDPLVAVDPIELTVRPGRTVVVDLSAETRLAGIGPLTIVARSWLEGVPIAVSLDSVVTPSEGVVGGTTAITGVDAAAERWMVPIQTTESASASRIVIVNPSIVGIATVDLVVDDVVVRSLELAPGRRAQFPVVDLGVDRLVVVVDASSPVVVSREIVGLTSRTAAVAVAISEPVALTDIR